MMEKKWRLAVRIDYADGSISIKDVPDWPGRPGLAPRILSMYELHGLFWRFERCKTCRHLERYEPPRFEDGLGCDMDGAAIETEIPVGGPSFPKCRAFSMKNGSTTDWRLNWPACGLWEAKEGADAEE